MTRRRIAIAALIAGLVVAAGCIAFLAEGAQSPTGRSGAPQARSPSTPISPTPSPTFTSATTVVESLSDLTPTTMSQPRRAIAAGRQTAPVYGTGNQGGAGGSATPSNSPGTAPDNPIPAVLYSISGGCTAIGSHFKCHLSLTASDGLASAGYITVYPSAGGKRDCVAYEPLASDAASIDGMCRTPYATTVLAVYSLNPAPTNAPLASAYLPWS